MTDPRFFNVKGPFTVSQIARHCGAELVSIDKSEYMIHGVASLDIAGCNDVSFFENKKYLDQFRISKAGLCILAADYVNEAPQGMILLVSKDPYRSYALAAQMFFPSDEVEAWIAPTAYVASSAKISKTCRIEPGVVIEDDVEIGEHSWIRANTVIRKGVVIGNDCHIHANVTLSHSLIGNKVTIFTGARLGQDGFGFAMGPQGHMKIPQLGRVIIGDNVEIGANTTIDRGAGPDTIIGKGTMIDNLVQIAHNVQIGNNCVIVSQVGISGSTQLGDFVIAAGQVGIAGHLKIGSGVKIAAQSGVMRDIEPGQNVGGSPAIAMREWLQQVTWVRRASLNKVKRG